MFSRVPSVHSKFVSWEWVQLHVALPFSRPLEGDIGQIRNRGSCVYRHELLLPGSLVPLTGTKTGTKLKETKEPTKESRTRDFRKTCNVRRAPKYEAPLASCVLRASSISPPILSPAETRDYSQSNVAQDLERKIFF